MKDKINYIFNCLDSGSISLLEARNQAMSLIEEYNKRITNCPACNSYDVSERSYGYLGCAECKNEWHNHTI